MLHTLAQHITLLHEDRRNDGETPRGGVIGHVPELTWTAAGRILLDVYRETIAAHREGRARESRQDPAAVCVRA